jgi:DNA-binding transcriptional ArsR family regulator
MAAATDGPGSADGGVVVHVTARVTLRSLRPVVRVVLEDVALGAAWQDGRLVSATSARLVAEHIGLDPGTVASALRVLRERGLVELEQPTRAGGRFGLAAYTVHLPTGIEVIRSPRASRPRTVPPHTVNPYAATTSAGSRRVRRATQSGRGEQGALDLGSGTR